MIQEHINSKNGILYEFNNNENLLIIFGGISQGIHIPVFEFFNSLKNTNCDKIFIRDFQQSWYHNGTYEYNSIDKLLKYLRKTIAFNNYKRVVCLGNSMGGYASILFGSLLNVDKVISFSPQTFIDKDTRTYISDNRWHFKIDRVNKTTKNSEYLNLVDVVRKSNVNTIIYFGVYDVLDFRHAYRLRTFKNVTLNPRQGYHDVIKLIKKSGELSEILKNLFL